MVDLYSIKPAISPRYGGGGRRDRRIVTVEDHWPQGGLGDAVLDALAGGGPLPRVRKLAVRTMPTSATPAEQLRAAGLDAAAIADAALGLIGG